MITYNHAAFVGKAIESVLMQETDDEWELVIGDDASGDGTTEIVRRYAEKHPDRIRASFARRNRGMMGNLAETMAQCRGRYVALLEGDDYWTDARKLKIQSLRLDSNPGSAVCAHNAVLLDVDGSERSYCDASQPAQTGFDDLLQGDTVPTCSVMYRRDAVPTIPEWCMGLGMGDWPLLLLATQRGTLSYSPETMGVYRRHGSGAWSSARETDKLEKIRTAYKAFRKHLALSKGQLRIVRGKLAETNRRLASRYMEAGDSRWRYHMAESVVTQVIMKKILTAGELWLLLRLSCGAARDGVKRVVRAW